ncbi:hypothetical protein MIR68_008659 [Amoeboaphelidium protococcarum]|nr:hypothetical protein MIR68_008659 [Amoeboaphelidium protococcarum]
MMDSLNNSADPTQIIRKMSEILGTGLGDEALAICIRLLQSGVNPEALAAVIRELRK